MPGLGLLLSQDIGVQRLRVKSDRVVHRQTFYLSIYLSIYLYIYIYIYVYVYVYVYSVTAPTRGGEERGGGGGGGGSWCSPLTDSPNLCKEAKLHRRSLGLIYGFTQRDPPPPTMLVLRVAVSGEGIKRWGIEGIRIGTSDRFGRGRGE